MLPPGESIFKLAAKSKIKEVMDTIDDKEFANTEAENISIKF